MVILLATGGAHASPENPFVVCFKLQGYEKASSAVYDKENVFDYMNGEADIYFPFGFQSLNVLQMKKAPGGGQAIVEAYDMGTPKGARDIFEQYTQNGGEIVRDLGETAWSDTTMLLFHRGRYFLRILADDSVGLTFNLTYKDLLELARSIDGALSKGGNGA